MQVTDSYTIELSYIRSFERQNVLCPYFKFLKGVWKKKKCKCLEFLSHDLGTEYKTGETEVSNKKIYTV